MAHDEASKNHPGGLKDYPKRNWKPEEDVWYEERPVGVNTLANTMKHKRRGQLIK
ncbi:hypothetical protein QZH41_019960, partial [Actinostola sp. cb2023]